jgi:5-methylcytosine-specific restriction endonuclease McrA
MTLPTSTLTECLNCGLSVTGRKKYCSPKCGSAYRTDQRYFGGKRTLTIGLSEGVCQLCAKTKVKGLSSHHIIGKENDPGNDYLMALCRGCHQIVTILAQRKFIDLEGAWERLTQFVIVRREGDTGERMFDLLQKKL